MATLDISLHLFLDYGPATKRYGVLASPYERHSTVCQWAFSLDTVPKR
jgi:hypothetical protein